MGKKDGHGRQLYKNKLAGELKLLIINSREFYNYEDQTNFDSYTYDIDFDVFIIAFDS